MGFISEVQKWLNVYKSISILHHVNRMKDKHCIIIPISEDNKFDKVQHCFMEKKLNRLDIEGTYLNTMKATCDHQPIWYSTV